MAAASLSSIWSVLVRKLAAQPVRLRNCSSSQSSAGTMPASSTGGRRLRISCWLASCAWASVSSACCARRTASASPLRAIHWRSKRKAVSAPPTSSCSSRAMARRSSSTTVCRWAESACSRCSEARRADSASSRSRRDSAARMAFVKAGPSRASRPLMRKSSAPLRIASTATSSPIVPDTIRNGSSLPLRRRV